MTSEAPVRPAPPSEVAPAHRPGRWRRLFPGDKRVWWAAAAVLVLLVVVGTIELLRPRDYYTGTNSVGTRSVVAQVPRGDALCVRDLTLPPGTGRFQLAVGPEPQPRLTAVLTAGGRTWRSSVPAGSPGASKVSFAIPPVPEGAPAVPARLCVTPRGGAASFGGMAMLQGDSVPPTIGGEPLGSRVAVWFAPPAGAQTTMLESLPRIAQRAALFRPGWVGAWTYWVILFLVTPGLVYAAIRLVARTAAREAPRLPAAATVALIALANGAVFATLTPAFETPDEPDHAAYVQFLGETGHRPTTLPGRGAYSVEEAAALDGVRTYSHVELRDARPPWLEADVRRWERRIADLEPLRRDEGGGATTPATHRPGYYLLAVPPYLAARAEGFYSSLWAMRLASALLAAITAACTVLFLRNLAPRAPLVLAAVAGLLVAFLPQFAFMSGGVNNDAGVIALAAVIVWLAARALRRGLEWRAALPLGLAVGLVPLFKATGAALYPALAVAVVALVLMRRDRTSLFGLAGAAAGFVIGRLVIAGVDELITPVPVPGIPGSGTLVAAGGIVSSVLNQPTLFLSYFWQTFLPPLPFMTDFFAGYDWPMYDTYIEEGFASFGWYAMEFPAWVYRGIVVAIGAVGIAAGVAAWRHRHALIPRLPQLLLVALTIAGVLGGVTAAYMSLTPRSGELPEQGRYAFIALPAFAAVAALACTAAPRRWLGATAAVLVTSMAALLWASEFLLLLRFYM